MTVKQKISASFWFCVLLIIFAALSRLVPHPYNFTPTGALGLFAGAYLSMRRYWLIPIIALLISDIYIGFYHPLAMASVYLAFVLCAVIGRFVLQQQRNVLRLALTSLSASCLFFVISNFGDWLSGINQYPMTISGLVECYVMAIPFFGNTVLGDLFYVTVLFGIFETMKTWIFHSQGVRTV